MGYLGEHVRLTVGAVDYLFKPLDPHVVRSKVSVFIDLFRQRQELQDAQRDLQGLWPRVGRTQRRRGPVVPEHRLLQLGPELPGHELGQLPVAADERFAPRTTTGSPTLRRAGRSAV